MRQNLFVLFAFAVSLHATTISFDTLPITVQTSFVDQGVTFTAVTGSTIVGQNGPNGTISLRTAIFPLAELRADIAGGASFVSVDLGDFGADADTGFLEVFNASNMSLGFTSVSIPASDAAMRTLSLSAEGISYAIFGGRAPSADGSSLFADNFTFTPEESTATPEPSSVVLTGAGLVALAIRRRRRA